NCKRLPCYPELSTVGGRVSGASGISTFLCENGDRRYCEWVALLGADNRPRFPKLVPEIAHCYWPVQAMRMGGAGNPANVFPLIIFHRQNPLSTRRNLSHFSKETRQRPVCVAPGVYSCNNLLTNITALVVADMRRLEVTLEWNRGLIHIDAVFRNGGFNAKY